MSDWGHESADLFRTARRGLSPSAGDRERVRGRIRAKIAAAAVGAAVTGAAAKAAGATSSAGAASAGAGAAGAGAASAGAAGAGGAGAAGIAGAGASVATKGLSLALIAKIAVPIVLAGAGIVAVPRVLAPRPAPPAPLAAARVVVAPSRTPSAASAIVPSTSEAAGYVGAIDATDAAGAVGAEDREAVPVPVPVAVPVAARAHVPESPAPLRTSASAHRAAGPVAAAPPSAPAASDGEEAALVGAIDAALRSGDSGGALRLAAEHQRRFPQGVLVEEREGARVVARCSSGRGPSASDAATAFLATHPRSPMRARINAACGTEEVR